MLSYKDLEFTDELIQEISTTVSMATEESVLTYIRAHNELAKGFQIKKASCAAFRKKISKYIITMHEIDSETAAFLYSSGIGREFVTVLSYFALECQLEEFAAIFGHAAFTLALILDERDDVQELGCRLLESLKGQALEKDFACNVVSSNMKSFATHFLQICNRTPDYGTPTELHTKRITELERQLKAEQKLRTDINVILKEEKKNASLQLAEKDQRIENLITERNELRSSFFEYEGKIDCLQKELGQLILTFDTNVAAAIESRLEGLTNSLFRKRIQLEQKIQCKDESIELLAQADEAIFRQAQTDRHTGNRLELQVRLSAISGKLKEVRDTRANAFHPIVDLLEIENRLVAEEQNLSCLLGLYKEAPNSPLIQALAARINTASEGENIHRLEQLLDELHNLGLPDSDFSFLQNKLGELYDRLLLVHGDRPLLQLPISPGLRFRFALGQGAPVALICDGHNILNSMDIFKDVRSRSHSEARKALSDSVSGLLKPYQECTATIVYDGPNHNREECTNNVSVIYSGGGKNEKHRADRRIEEMLNWREYLGRTTPVYIVTADYELGQEARESGAEVIPLEHFEWMLSGV